MRAVDIIIKKRDRQELTHQEIDFFVGIEIGSLESFSDFGKQQLIEKDLAQPSFHPELAFPHPPNRSHELVCRNLFGTVAFRSSRK